MEVRHGRKLCNAPKRVKSGRIAGPAPNTEAPCSAGDNSTEPLPQGPSTLQITDLTVGEGTEAVAGKTAFIAYSLWRFDPAGTDQKGLHLQTNTFSWVLGSNSAIAGMSQGTIGMKVGGKRRLVIPPSLAYGATGTSGGEVRPNEWIVFEVELLNIV
jgi:FKBP-type peptidyl-prolyl cis-trans isomerase FkpA